jgi:hypothetical protein
MAEASSFKWNQLREDWSGRPTVHRRFHLVAQQLYRVQRRGVGQLRPLQQQRETVDAAERLVDVTRLRGDSLGLPIISAPVGPRKASYWARVVGPQPRSRPILEKVRS